MTDKPNQKRDDRWQSTREELARYPELPRFTLSRRTVQGMVDELSLLESVANEALRVVLRMGHGDKALWDALHEVFPNEVPADD